MLFYNKVAAKTIYKSSFLFSLAGIFSKFVHIVIEKRFFEQLKKQNIHSRLNSTKN